VIVEQLCVIGAGVLHAAIRVMHQPGRGSPAMRRG
jgi:hypothetical protein